MTSVLLPLQPTGSDRLVADTGMSVPASGSELLPFTQAMSDANVTLASTQSDPATSAPSNGESALSANAAPAETSSGVSAETDELLAQLGTSISLTVSAKVPMASPQSMIADLVITQAQELKDQAVLAQNDSVVEAGQTMADSKASAALAATQALAESDMVLIGENLQANLIKLGQTASAQNQDAADSRMMIQIVPNSAIDSSESSALLEVSSADLIKAGQIKAIIFNPDEQTCDVQISLSQQQAGDNPQQDETIVSLKADIVSVQSAQMGDLTQLPKTIVFQGLNENSPLYRIEIVAQSGVTLQTDQAKNPDLALLGETSTDVVNAVKSVASSDDTLQLNGSQSHSPDLVSAVPVSASALADEVSVRDFSAQPIISTPIRNESLTPDANEAIPSVSLNLFVMKAITDDQSVATANDTSSKSDLSTNLNLALSEAGTKSSKTKLNADGPEDDQVILTADMTTQSKSTDDDQTVQIGPSTLLMDDGTAQTNAALLLSQVQNQPLQNQNKSASQTDLPTDTDSRGHDQALILKAQILLAQSQQNMASAPNAQRMSQIPQTAQALPQSQTRQQLSATPSRSFVNPTLISEPSSASPADLHMISAGTSILPNQPDIKTQTMSAHALDQMQAKQIEVTGSQKHDVAQAQSSHGFSEEMVRTLDQMNGSLQINLGDQRDSQTVTQPNAQAAGSAELGQRDVKPEASLSDPNAASRQTRSLTAEIRMRALERQVIYAAQANHDEVRMQLYPPGLGLIMIKLTMDGSKLTMKTRATNAEAVDALTALESDLKTSLSGHGIELTGFAVSDKEPDADQRQKDTPNQEDKVNQSVTDGAFALDLNA